MTKTVENIHDLVVALNGEQGKTFQRAKMVPGGVEFEFSNMGYNSEIVFKPLPVENHIKTEVEIIGIENAQAAEPVPVNETEEVIPNHSPTETIPKKRGRPFAKAQ